MYIYNGALFFLIAFLALLFYFDIDKVPFDISASFCNVILKGYSRLVAGIISGLFIIVASHSNLILGTYSNSLYSLAVFSIISGFSERFVPDLISSKQLGRGEEKAN